MAIHPLNVSGGSYDDSNGTLTLVLSFTEPAPSAPEPDGVSGFRTVAPTLTFQIPAPRKVSPGPWTATYRRGSDGSLWQATYDAASGTWTSPTALPEP